MIINNKLPPPWVVKYEEAMLHLSENGEESDDLDIHGLPAAGKKRVNPIKSVA